MREKIHFFNYRVIAALLIMIAVLYFAIDAVQTQTYAGTELSFSTSGVVTVTNDADQSVAVLATASSAFTLTSDRTSGRLQSTRQGTGRTAVNVWEGELASGITELAVTRGSDINFVLTGGVPINATVAARDAGGNQQVLMVAGVVCLGLLFFMSYTTGHALIKFVLARVFSQHNPV